MGRFIVVDPSSESYYSTGLYAYCGSNPINRIDPTGADWYENENGDVHWQEGSEDLEHYTRFGSFVSIQLGKNSYINAYQNAGVLANQAVNAFDLIASSSKLQNQFLGKYSPLSEASKSALFNSLNSRSMNSLGKFNAVVEVQKGLITTMKGWSQKSINRIAKNYGWNIE